MSELLRAAHERCPYAQKLISRKEVIEDELNSLLRLFMLEVNSASNSIMTHVRYISPDNVLKDLYRILNCDLVTCTEIEVNGKLFDVYSDDGVKG